MQQEFFALIFFTLYSIGAAVEGYIEEETMG
jgi:hypothetical protein